MVKLVTYAFKS